MKAQQAPLVLIVEDDDAIRDALQEVLEACGLRTATAGHGRAALDWLAAAAELPALILLDLMMPEMDGRAFRQAQQNDPRYADIPVLLLTAVHDADQQGADLGLPVIRKPVNAPDLLDAIQRQIA